MAELKAQVLAALSSTADRLDQTVKSHPVGKQLTAKLPPTVRPAYVVALSFFVLSVLILCCCGQDAFVNLVGFVYPLYASIKAIKSPSKEDDTLWLTYWVVYSLFTVLESLTDLLLTWVPMYYLMKCGFLVWCFCDRTQGAMILFKLASPALDKIIPTVDGLAAKASQATQNVTHGATVTRTTSTNSTKAD